MKFSLDKKSLGIAGLQGDGRRATRFKGLALAIGGVLFISANFVTVKYVLREYNIFTFLPLWFVIASLASMTWILAGRLPWRAQITRHFWPLIGVGVTNGFGAEYWSDVF